MTMSIPLSRRSTLAGLACLVVPGGAIAARADVPLAHLARAKGISFGTSVSAGPMGSLTGMLPDMRMMALVDREADVIVAENEMKPYVIAGSPDVMNFAPGDRIADWAGAHGKRLRGHTLLWNNSKYVPQWMDERFGAAPATVLGDWLTKYVGTVCAHYGSRIHAWDCVNETIDSDTGEQRDTVFARKLGFDALRIAFETARERVPSARLVYNDYMSWGAGSAKHRAGVLRLLERFRRENVPVDALGLQSHIGTEQGTAGANGDMSRARADERDWRVFVDAVVAMGYRLAITEFDVSDKQLTGSIAARDAQVAAVGGAYLDMMLSYSQLDELVCWGLSDRYSWLQSFSARADGQPLRPLPFDANYRAKPLRDAIARSLRNAPDHRRARLRAQDKLGRR